MDIMLGEITLDKKRRLALGRILKEKKVSSFDVYQTDKGYLLKPKISIPLEEAWIFENQKVTKSLKKGLSQKPRHKLGSFVKLAED